MCVAIFSFFVLLCRDWQKVTVDIRGSFSTLGRLPHWYFMYSLGTFVTFHKLPYYSLAVRVMQLCHLQLRARERGRSFALVNPLTKP
jgi:hypothetical protein